jgi:hypothetical protein
VQPLGFLLDVGDAPTVALLTQRLLEVAELPFHRLFPTTKRMRISK